MAEQRELGIAEDFRFYRLIQSNSPKQLEPGDVFPSLAEIKLRKSAQAEDGMESEEELRSSCNAIRTVMQGSSAFQAGAGNLFS